MPSQVDLAQSFRLPRDYLERVYAGVLGKLVGVYIGRPFENWTHQRILGELGHIHYYVHEKLGKPLLVTDDDVSGTFQFVRALEEHGCSADITAEDIGRTWLNNVIEYRTVFWWGGRGVSTEHTAFLNLKQGIPAPLSGSIQTNGKSVAEQIGAQIFIDGWALVSPGNPQQAAKLAHAAGSVSHDGESVFAAQLWAAMEAEAFVSNDIDHLLDTGLAVIPQTSLIAKVAGQVRQWVRSDQDWLKTRDRIEATYGYDKFHGNCHVIPNHAIMIMTILYANNDFDEAMHIVNTCGWDTDCNAGNVGCLIAIIQGLSAFEGKQDWRGPLADQAIISSADGGYSVNNAARIAIDITNLGRRLAGEEPLLAPKGGAQFHFTLPGSVQGFQVYDRNADSRDIVSIAQKVDHVGNPGLAIHLNGLNANHQPIEISTPVFGSKEVLEITHYEFMGSPLLYPGQTLSAKFRGDPSSQDMVKVKLRLQVYGENDELRALHGPATTITSTEMHSLNWVIPDEIDGRPIQRAGILIEPLSQSPYDGTIWLDSLGWQGTPRLSLHRPAVKCGDAWYRAWVNGVDIFHRHLGAPSFVISQSAGEGIITIGTREWTDYRFSIPKFKINLGTNCGVAIRVQGLNRYYSLVFARNGRIALVKALDQQRITLASVPFAWALDGEYSISFGIKGDSIRGCVGDTEVTATDSQYTGGGIGLIAEDGSISADSIDISPL